MAEKKNKGVGIVVGGHKIDNVGSMVGEAVDKVAGKKLKVDASDLGKKLDKAAKGFELDIDKLVKKKK